MLPIEEPALTPGLIRERTDALTRRLRAAAECAGRDPDGFRLVAVTKGFGIEVVRSAIEAGLRIFGENRVQEAIPKVEALPEAEWHLVGHLQSNKVRRALELFETIHSVDSVELLRRIERIGHDEGRRPQVLLQVNVSGEETKSGFPLALIRDEGGQGGELGRLLGELCHARPIGLMTMAPPGVDPAEARGLFAQLRELRDALAERSGIPLPELSMGMTADAEAAVAEGATLVRIGTAIFGPRPH
jgi:pyridoxal phosphate enzyme (YggS family)